MSAVVLVIGYGNELRRDDGVGPQAARAVTAWGRPGVQALAVHQLTPELAEQVASAARVIFVDARPDDGGAVEVSRLGPVAARPGLGHTGDPRELLALVAALYGRCPEAWLVTVPTVDLDFGEGLSPAAQRGLSEALRRIRMLCDCAK